MMESLKNVGYSPAVKESSYMKAGRLLSPGADGIITGGQLNFKEPDQAISNIRYSRLENGAERLVLDLSQCNFAFQNSKLGSKVKQVNKFDVKYDPGLRRISLRIIDNRYMGANLKELNDKLKESKLLEKVRAGFPPGTHKVELLIDTAGGEQGPPKLNVYEFEKPGRIVLDFLPVKNY